MHVIARIRRKEMTGHSRGEIEKRSKNILQELQTDLMPLKSTNHRHFICCFSLQELKERSCDLQWSREDVLNLRCPMVEMLSRKEDCEMTRDKPVLLKLFPPPFNFVFFL